MSDDCSRFSCQIGTEPFTTSDNRDYKAIHSWNLKLKYGAIELADVSRSLNLSTKYANSYTADLYSPADGNTFSACGLTSSGSITGSFSDSMKGSMSTLIYADLKNDVYLIEKSTEQHTSTYTTQNPFHYLLPYGAQDAVAYFIKFTKVQTTSYELWIKGVRVFDEKADPKTTTYSPQPIVWPNPSSTAMFFLGAPGYEWLNDTFFYWYNDPSDLGPFPCLDKATSSPGFTGYEKAYADGGKDFFYPPWFRSNAFIGNSMIHQVWTREAEDRFRAVFGGHHDPLCKAPFSRDYTVSLPISSALVGNAVVTDKQQFYSFWLPELKKAMTKMGTPEMTAEFLKKVEGANVCFPISVT